MWTRSIEIRYELSDKFRHEYIAASSIIDVESGKKIIQGMTIILNVSTLSQSLKCLLYTQFTMSKKICNIYKTYMQALNLTQLYSGPE